MFLRNPKKSFCLLRVFILWGILVVGFSSPPYASEETTEEKVSPSSIKILNSEETKEIDPKDLALITQRNVQDCLVPSEILLHIFSFINKLEDLYKMNRVCHMFKELCQPLLKPLYKQIISEKFDDKRSLRNQILRALIDSGIDAERKILELSSPDQVPYFYPLVIFCPHLTTINLHASSFGIKEAKFLANPKLRTVHLIFSNQDPVDYEGLKIVLSNSQLTSFSMFGSKPHPIGADIIRLLMAHPSLRSLCIAGHLLGEEGVRMFAALEESHSKLRSLFLADDRVTNEAYQALNENPFVKRISRPG